MWIPAARGSPNPLIPPTPPGSGPLHFGPTTPTLRPPWRRRPTRSSWLWHTFLNTTIGMPSGGMRVVVRCRPSDRTVVDCNPHVGTTISLPAIVDPTKLTAMSAAVDQPDTKYEFTSVLGKESTQREAYMACGLPMLEAALDGQRACLFAYGQTGSGKTFSLLVPAQPRSCEPCPQRTAIPWPPDSIHPFGSCHHASVMPVGHRCQSP